MNRIFPQRLSLIVSLVTLAVLGRGLLARSAPIPGTTATSAAALAPSVQAAFGAPSPKIEQADSSTTQRPGVNTNPSPDSSPVAPTPETTLTPTTPSAQAPSGTARRDRVRDYIGIGGTIGLNGNRTSLGGGGFAILSRTGLFKLGNSINLSLHNSNVVFGNRTATSIFALTLEAPIRNKTSERIVVSPFFGGGVLVRNPDNITKVGPLLTGGVDIPLSRRFTAIARVDVGFLKEDTEVGLSLGIGYNFNLFDSLFGHRR